MDASAKVKAAASVVFMAGALLPNSQANAASSRRPAQRIAPFAIPGLNAPSTAIPEHQFSEGRSVTIPLSNDAVLPPDPDVSAARDAAACITDQQTVLRRLSGSERLPQSDSLSERLGVGGPHSMNSGRIEPNRPGFAFSTRFALQGNEAPSMNVHVNTGRGLMGNAGDMAVGYAASLAGAGSTNSPLDCAGGAALKVTKLPKPGSGH